MIVFPKVLLHILPNRGIVNKNIIGAQIQNNYVSAIQLLSYFSRASCKVITLDLLFFIALSIISALLTIAK